MRNRHKIVFVVLCALIFETAKSQTAISSYITTTASAVQSNFTQAGYVPSAISSNTHIFHSNNNFSPFFGSTYGSASAATTTIVTGFVAGGKTFKRITASPTTPFTKIAVIRKDNPVYVGNRFSAFFEYSSVRTTGGTEQYDVRDNGNLNIYIKPTAVYTMEAALNNFSLSYGTDNIFSNRGTVDGTTKQGGGGESGNNIERVDLIYQPGITASTSGNLSKIGIMINERGGNDAFKVAAITGLDGDGNVSSLGSVLSIAASSWGAVGPDVSTVVFMGLEGSGNIKPKELVSMASNPSAPTAPITQKVSGMFVSLADLGIALNTPIYGLAIFPGDVTGDYLALGSASSPRDTPDSGVGGLDLMSGSFMAAEADVVLPVTLISFDGRLQEKQTILTWTTTQELDFDGFEIFYSPDAKNWQSRGFVSGGRGIKDRGNYEFSDNAKPGINYYKLKLIDLDGSFSFSRIVKVVSDYKNEPFIFPNPASDKVFVSNTSRGEAVHIKSIELVAATGTSVKKVNPVNGAVSTDGMPVNDLPKGQYFIKIEYFDGYHKVFKFIKN